MDHGVQVYVGMALISMMQAFIEMDSSEQEANSKLQESLAKEKHGTAGARARTVHHLHCIGRNIYFISHYNVSLSCLWYHACLSLFCCSIPNRLSPPLLNFCIPLVT